MSKFKKIMCLLLTLVMMLSVFAGFGVSSRAISFSDIYDTNSNTTFTYSTLSNGNLMIRGAESVPEVLVIPAEIDGVPVEAIGLRAFSDKYQLKQVIISEGIKTIGEYAFAECENLTSVTIPVSVEEIEGSAFWYCDKLGDVVMLGVEHIGMAAFGYCTNVKRIYISYLLKEIEFAAFDKSGLTEVYYCGTVDDLMELEIGTYNEPFENSELFFIDLEQDNTTSPQPDPVEPTNVVIKPTSPDPIETLPMGETLLMGDTDFSGKVNIKDATLIQKYLAKIVEFDSKTQFVANVMHTEKINVKAATAIQKFCAKIDVDAEIDVEKVYIP